MIGTLLKRLSGRLGAGTLWSGKPSLIPLDLERDWPQLEEMMLQEEWPFLRCDFEISHGQPRSTSFVAKKNGDFAGFFATHHFGDVGYLDMMIIPRRFRRAGIARPLYFRTIKAMKAKGLRSWVVHTTNDSARLFRLLGFKPGQDFTLLGRDRNHPRAQPTHPTAQPGGRLLSHAEIPFSQLVELDAAIFGLDRTDWQRTLYDHPKIKFLGLEKEGRLVASLCLRPRRNDTLCLDQVNTRDPSVLEPFVRAVLHRHQASRIECFAKTNGRLHTLLTEVGFTVPDFFVPIGPLREWRKGRTGPLGTGDRIQCLSWF